MKKQIVLVVLILGLFAPSLWAMPDLYKVVYRKGDVKMTRGGEEPRKILKGDFLIGKDLVETSASGLVILGFGENYASRMKVGPNSKLELEGKILDPDDNNEEKTQFFLKVGNILVDYINKDKQKNKLKVRTKSASMAVRGTEFFIHATPDGQTLVAVRSGVVLAKHNDKVAGIPLTSEEGVVFTNDGGSGKLNPPSWYKEINWELNDFNQKIEFFMHGGGIEKVTLNEIVSKVISVTGDSYDKISLEGEPEKWQKECEKDKPESCTRLGLYLMKNGKPKEVKGIVQGLFSKACNLKEARGCVWLGRVEYEFGNKDAGKGHILNHCERNNAYACYSLWELEKANGSADLAEGYRKKALSIMHDLNNFDETFAQFEEACGTEDPEACLNIGILSEQIGKVEKSKEFYVKACDLGSGAACSNLGFLFQESGKVKEANKHYTKACFLDEAVGCYNLACLFSKDSKVDLAKQYLKMAVIGGYTDWEHITTDTDLKTLRKAPDYEAFIKDLKGSGKTKAP